MGFNEGLETKYGDMTVSSCCFLVDFLQGGCVVAEVPSVQTDRLYGLDSTRLTACLCSSGKHGSQHMGQCTV